MIAGINQRRRGSLTMSDRLIVSFGYKKWIKIICYAITASWLGVGLYALFIEPDYPTFIDYWFWGVFGGLVMPVIVAFMINQLEIRVYEDRIEQRRFTVKTIYYPDVGRIHFSDWDPYRIRVFKKGAKTPGIAIHNNLAEWRQLGVALLDSVPDHVEFTGSDQLRKELTEPQVSPGGSAHH
jgi:hypothetical protein